MKSIRRLAMPVLAWALLAALAGAASADASKEAAGDREGGSETVDAAGTPLAPAEVDTFLETLFERQRRLTRLEAEVRVVRSGGVFNRERVTYGTLRAEVPNRLLFLDRGTSEAPLPPEACRIILVDGTYFWELEPRYEGEPREGERRRLEGLGPEGGAADLASFFIGKRVATAEELRQHFAIDAVRVAGAASPVLRLTLRPKESVGTTIEIRIGEEGVLPRRVKTVTEKKLAAFGAAAGTSRRSVRVQEVRRLRTNLDGLPPFPPSTFVPPVDGSMAILDGKGRPLSGKELTAAVAEARLRLLEKKQPPQPDE